MTATLQEAPPPRLRILPLLPTDPAGCSVMLPVTAIDPNPWRPRFSPAASGREDDLRLTASIAREGVRENLLVRPAGAGRYQLLVGDRRLRCAMAAGRAEVPAIVRALDDRQARVFTLGENLRRDRLHFLDEADAVAGLLAEHWTLAQVAAELGKPLAWVARRRRLLSLTPAWRRLAEERQGFTATWSAADFEQIAILEPAAQDDLLTTSRHRLERCTTARELVQLIRSLTHALGAFPWKQLDGSNPREHRRCAGVAQDAQVLTQGLNNYLLAHVRLPDLCEIDLVPIRPERPLKRRGVHEGDDRFQLMRLSGKFLTCLPGRGRQWFFTTV